LGALKFITTSEATMIKLALTLGIYLQLLGASLGLVPNQNSPSKPQTAANVRAYTVTSHRSTKPLPKYPREMSRYTNPIDFKH
jgi:hypothetical protein